MADQNQAPPSEMPEGLDEFLAGGAASPGITPSAQPGAPGDAPQGLDAFIQPEMNEEKYGGLGQKIKTAAEGAADAATFGLSTHAEVASGLAKPEDIQGRKDTNPVTRMASQAAGLVGSAFLAPEAGAAALMTRAGEGVAKAVGLGAAESTAAKIGSSALKGFVENGLFQSGDEVSKMALGDPNQSVETAVADIGLSGLIGAGANAGGKAIGEGAKSLWKATIGKETDGVLRAIANKVGGIEGQIPDHIEEAIRATGMEVAPEIRGALMDDPFVRQAFQTLQDSATTSGIKAQESVKSFKNQMSEALMTSLGKTPEDVAALPLMSENKLGEQIKETLVSKLESMAEPISKSYDKISNKFKNTLITDDVRAEFADALAKTVDNGVSPEAAESKLMQRVMTEVPKLSTLEQLRNYGIGLRNETSGLAKQELWQVGGKIRRILGDMEDKVLTRTVESEAPALIAEHAETKGAYKELKGLIGDLNDRLKVGSHTGPKTFINALKDMDGEAVLRRLSPKGKADIISELSTNFPEVAQQVKSFHLNQVLKNAADRAGEGETLNSRALIKSLNGLSPEMREFVLPPGAMDKMTAIETLMDKLPGKVGKSGTPQGLDALMSHVPSSATGLAVGLLGGGPVGGAAAYYLSKTLGRDVPDAARLAMLKFLGSSQPVEAGGFKAMVDMIKSTIKAENNISKTIKSVFQAGREVIPAALMPSREDRDKLDKRLKDLQQNPADLLKVGGDTGYYMPEHAQAIGQTSATAVNYLNSLRPDVPKGAPFDSELPANSTAISEYNKALDIAQQPLIVVGNIKKGTITTKEVVALKTMYPTLYANMSKKMMDHIVDHLSKGEKIDYNTRQGISMFLGKPMDSTMKPMSILSAQPSAQGRQNQQNASQEQSQQAKSYQAKGLEKLPGSYMTQGQAREAKRMKD